MFGQEGLSTSQATWFGKNWENQRRLPQGGQKEEGTKEKKKKAGSF